MLFKVGLLLLVSVLIVVILVVAARAVMAVAKATRDVARDQVCGGIRNFDDR